MLSPLIGLLVATSLAPVDPELIRSSYGQEALFRFELGVDAGLGMETPKICPDPRQGWGASAQHQAMEAALKRGQFFEAGKELGAWQKAGQCR
ncbi:MAG: hypothetical protein RLZZ158_941 [Cyanobacteriota bacterium]|jgi:hypothetical protein